MSALEPGARGTIVVIRSSERARIDRLVALGVTPNASIEVLQTSPAFVFMCDQTELAVERSVAGAILVKVGP